MIRATPITPATTHSAFVGRFLAARRTALKLDQEALGWCCRRESTWSRIETGASAMSLDLRTRACDALKVTPSSVMCRGAASVEIARRGVEVLTQPDGESDKAVAFLGRVALAALVIAVLSKK